MDFLEFIIRKQKVLLRIFVGLALLLWTLILIVFYFETDIMHVWTRKKFKQHAEERPYEQIVSEEDIPVELTDTLDPLEIGCGGVYAHFTKTDIDGGKDIIGGACNDCWWVAIPAEYLVQEQKVDKQNCQMVFPMKNSCCVYTENYFLYIQSYDQSTAFPSSAELEVECFNGESEVTYFGCW